MGFLRDHELADRVDAHIHDISAFFLESDGVEYDSASYYVGGAFTEYSGRDASHHETFPFEVEGMACIRPALETRDRGVAACEHVHNLPFSLIAPLEAEDYD